MALARVGQVATWPRGQVVTHNSRTSEHSTTSDRGKVEFEQNAATAPVAPNGHAV